MSAKGSSKQSRQASIFDQDKLTNSKVLVNVPGHLGDLLLVGLAGLGVGYVDVKQIPDAFVKKLEKSHIDYFDKLFFTHEYFQGQEKYDFVFDGLANQSLKDKLINKDNYFQLFTQDDDGLGTNIITKDFVDKKVNASNISSGVLAGVLLNYFTKMVHEQPVNVGFSYPNVEFSSGHSGFIVGAGATGTYVALQSLGYFDKLDIVDDDIIEDNNLNRQMLFYGSIGRPKAQTLFEKINKISNIKGSYIKDFITEDNLHLTKGYDVVFGCVDNFKARKILNSYAIDNKYLFVEGGTGPLTGKVSLYSPGNTDCTDCKRQFTDDPIKDSCANRYDPSTIIPNMIIGSLMVEYALRAIEGNPTNKIIVYDGGVYSYESGLKQEGCNCASN